MEYQILQIGEICTRFSSGKNITASDIHEEGDFPVYGGNGLRGYTSRSNFKGECVLIGRQGAYCGNVRYFSGEGYMSEHAIVGVTNEMHDTKYFAYKLSLLGLGRLSGQAAQPGLSVTKLSKMKLEMPPLPTQRKIASILSAYDNLIENNRRRIKLLEQMAQNLYKEWFVRFRFPGYQNAEFENGTPKGWEEIPLDNLLINGFNGGWGEDSETEKCSFMGYVIRGTDIEDVRMANYDKVPLRFHKKSDIENKHLLANDIILELSNGNLDNIGRTLFVTENILNRFNNVMSASFCKTLRFACSTDAYMVYRHITYLQKSGLLNFYKNTGTNGINNFNYKRFLKHKFIIPNDKKLVEQLMKIDMLTSNLADSSHLLTAQRDLLLPRLMSGKLSV